jgi:hypothetical protein
LVLAQAAGDPLTAAARSSAFALQAIPTGPGYEPSADAASAVLLISAFLLGHPPFRKNLKQCGFSVRNMTQTEPQQVKGHSTGRTSTKNGTRDKSRDQFTLNVDNILHLIYCIYYKIYTNTDLLQALCPYSNTYIRRQC